MRFEFPESRIQVFCKAPIAGEVMTRLIPEMGEAGASQLHEELASRIITMCEHCRLAPVQLWCTPVTDHAFFTSIGNESIPRYLQTGDDLGERMYRGARFALEEDGADTVVIVGTDCPELDEAYLRLALQQLASHEAVIGPAEDGGYGLIGLRSARQEFFSGIDWGGDNVCADTCRAFNAAGLAWSLLPLLWDIDRPADLKRYRSR